MSELLKTVYEKYELHHDIGELVYLRTDTDQHGRIVTGINIRESSVQYALAFGANESWHYEFEISKDRDIVKATS